MLAVLAGASVHAQPAPPGPPGVGTTVWTPNGPAMTTGTIGTSAAIVALPGAAANGVLRDNGNGSSTLIVPGEQPQILFTPR